MIRLSKLLITKLNMHKIAENKIREQQPSRRQTLK